MRGVIIYLYPLKRFIWLVRVLLDFVVFIRKLKKRG
nr:MAG TPA: hypothetical protein [Ackermannviridae sp.]